MQMNLKEKYYYMHLAMSHVKASVATKTKKDLWLDLFLTSPNIEASDVAAPVGCIKKTIKGGIDKQYKAFNIILEIHLNWCNFMGCICIFGVGGVSQGKIVKQETE